jgi:hypothetical protein
MKEILEDPKMNTWKKNFILIEMTGFNTSLTDLQNKFQNTTQQDDDDDDDDDDDSDAFSDDHWTT